MNISQPNTDYAITEYTRSDAGNGEQLSFVITGHVDHGKSTVIGRLLADTGSLPDGKLDAIKDLCKRNSKPFEYAFLIDALKDEQAQGITIDISRTFFKTAQRNYTIIDAPGHIEFLKNMITGAAHAEAAFLVIDAKEGIRENSKRHGYMLSLLGIRQFYVLINKMDLADYSVQVYKDISLEFAEFLGKTGIQPIDFIPVSAFEGENITMPSAKMPWYNGPTVLSALDSFQKQPSLTSRPLRFPVQDVYKFTADGDERRIIAGLTETGCFSKGDEVVFYPSGKTSRISTIEGFNVQERDTVTSGYSAGITLDTQVYLTRGEVMTKVNDKPPMRGTELKANIFWMGRQPIVKNKLYKIKIATQEAPFRLKEIIKVMNTSSLDLRQEEQVDRHEAAEIILETYKPVAFDPASEIETMGRFVIVDEYEVAGGGIILDGRENSGDKGFNNPVTAVERENRYNIKSRVIWITGPKPGLKKELAKMVERRLFDMGKNPVWIDSEDIRSGLSRDLNFSDSNRFENVRRIAEVAALLRNRGFVVIVTAISPYLNYRKNAENIIGREHYLEIDVLGQHSPIYQPDENADLIIRNAGIEQLETYAEQVISMIL